MESRQEPRFETDQEVVITVLGDGGMVLPGRILNFSGKGLCLFSTRSLASGKALKIELSDTLMLGEVIYCRGEEGGYQVGVVLDQALYHTRDLAALAGRLLHPGPRSRTYDSEVTPL
jgi:hypothetical protein